MYTVKNYKAKKELVADLAAGRRVEVFQPGPFGPQAHYTGDLTLEGPHYPAPHRWYARGAAVDGVLVRLDAKFVRLHR